MTYVNKNFLGWEMSYNSFSTPKLKYYPPNRIKDVLIKTNIKRNLIPQDFEIYIVNNYNNY